MFIVFHLFSSCFGFVDIFFHLLACRLDLPTQSQLFASCANLPVQIGKLVIHLRFFLRQML